MIVPGRSLTKAREIAQANADRTKEPWVIFFDTSGNLRIERRRLGPDPRVVFETVTPGGERKEDE